MTSTDSQTMLQVENRVYEAETEAEAFPRALLNGDDSEAKQARDSQLAEAPFQNSAEVLKAVVQWIDALDKVGIVHTDISSAHILPNLENSAEGRQATIIDRVLAHLKLRFGNEQLSDQPQEALGSPTTTREGMTKATDIRQSDRPHHQVTGTLPFIAHELLSQFRGPTSEEPIQHELHHDVESVVWVMVYLCMWCGGKTVQR